MAQRRAAGSAGSVLAWHEQCWGLSTPDQQPDWVRWVLVPPGNLGRSIVWRRWPEKEKLMSLVALLQGAIVLWAGNISKPCERKGFLDWQKLRTISGRSRCCLVSVSHVPLLFVVMGVHFIWAVRERNVLHSLVLINWIIFSHLKNHWNDVLHHKSVYLFSLKRALKVNFAYLCTMLRETHPCGEDMVCMPSGGNGLPTPHLLMKECRLQYLCWAACKAQDTWRSLFLSTMRKRRKARSLGSFFFHRWDVHPLFAIWVLAKY